MKKIFQSFLILSLTIVILFVLNGGSPCEAGTARVAVLPFKINAEKDFSFLQDGIQDMLGSRLAWEDKVFVIDRDTTNSAAGSFENFTGKSRALLIGAKLNADYIIYGSLTIMGENASIDARITDITGKNEPTAIFKQIQGAAQVIPEINRFATDINTIVFHRASPQQFQPAQQAPGPRHPFMSTPNQNFISMESGDMHQAFWKSRTLEHSVVGMDFGDVNNDGIKEIICISDHAVYIYQIVNNSFTQIAKIAENRINAYIGVDVGDINHNGTPEIFVSSLVADKNRASSFVVEYNGSDYKTILDESPWYYRIVRPLDNTPVLMGQRQEYRRGDIYSSPVSIMESDGSRYIPGQMVLASDQANVLGVGYADLDNSGQKNVIAFNHQDYLHIFSSPNRPVWTGEDKLGGSVSRFLLEPDDPTDDLIPQYFPMRLRTADTDQDKKVEVIAAANHDTAQSLVRGFRSFSKSHIQALTWDSLGLRPIWNTRTLPGRISDFFIEDFDNDGIVEIVIAIVAKKNALLSLNSESYIIAYELMPGK